MSKPIAHGKGPLRFTFHPKKPAIVRGQQSLDILVERDGVYFGYVNVHTHQTIDGSLSVGLTIRSDTKRRP